MEEERTIIRIRRGLNGFPYSACTDDGYFIMNAERIEQLREHWKRDLRNKKVKLVKELSLYPKGVKIEYKVYGYARVSTRHQADGNSLEAQELALKEAGAEIIFKDSFTGTSTDRPEFKKLLSVLKGGDTLIVTKLDRFARSMSQANDLIKELLEKRVKINVLNIGMIDNSPASKLTRTIFLAFAEFEKDMIVERTQEGKAIAREKEGFRDGRPKKYSTERLDEAMKLLDEYSYKMVEAKTGISVSTLTRERRRRKAESSE